MPTVRTCKFGLPPVCPQAWTHICVSMRKSHEIIDIGTASNTHICSCELHMVPWPTPWHPIGPHDVSDPLSPSHRPIPCPAVESLSTPAISSSLQLHTQLPPYSCTYNAQMAHDVSTHMMPGNPWAPLAHLQHHRFAPSTPAANLAHLQRFLFCVHLQQLSIFCSQVPCK